MPQDDIMKKHVCPSKRDLTKSTTLFWVEGTAGHPPWNPTVGWVGGYLSWNPGYGPKIWYIVPNMDDEEWFRIGWGLQRPCYAKCPTLPWLPRTTTILFRVSGGERLTPWVGPGKLWFLGVPQWSSLLLGGYNTCKHQPFFGVSENGF
jgi:hypothetical protein